MGSSKMDGIPAMPSCLARVPPFLQAFSREEVRVWGRRSEMTRGEFYQSALHTSRVRELTSSLAGPTPLQPFGLDQGTGLLFGKVPCRAHLCPAEVQDRQMTCGPRPSWAGALITD